MANRIRIAALTVLGGAMIAVPLTVAVPSASASQPEASVVHQHWPRPCYMSCGGGWYQPPMRPYQNWNVMPGWGYGGYGNVMPGWGYGGYSSVMPGWGYGGYGGGMGMGMGTGSSGY